MLQRATAKGRSVRPSVCLSVCLSVCHTRDPRLIDSVYRTILYTTRQSDASSFLRPNFVVMSLWVHAPPKEC